MSCICVLYQEIIHMAYFTSLGPHNFLVHSIREIVNLHLVYCFKLYIEHLQITKISWDETERSIQLYVVCMHSLLLCSWSSFLYNPTMHSMGLINCSLLYIHHQEVINSSLQCTAIAQEHLIQTYLSYCRIPSSKARF